jgi:carbonic anhydrase
MNELIGRVFSFEKSTFPASGELFPSWPTLARTPRR